MMPANNFRNLRPRKLNAADNLMSNHGVIGHFTKLFGIERRGLAEQTLIHRYFADVVQIARRPQCPYLGTFHTQRLSDGLGVASNSNRVSMDVDMLDVDRGGKGFEGVVVEA